MDTTKFALHSSQLLGFACSYGRWLTSLSTPAPASLPELVFNQKPFRTFSYLHFTALATMGLNSSSMVYRSVLPCLHSLYWEDKLSSWQ